MTDTRSNAEIVTDAWKGWNTDITDRRLVADVIVAALATAGRLVTPEHDARHERLRRAVDMYTDSELAAYELVQAAEEWRHS